MRHASARVPAALACLLALVAPGMPAAPAASAADAKPGVDWPQFLGPTRDGVYPVNDVAWPAGGPKILWSADVGQGWAGPVVADGKLLVYHRKGNRAVLDCLDPATGKPIWSSGHPTDYADAFGFDEGPRATPTAAGGRVFTMGAEGKVSAFDLASGTLLWSIDAVKQFRGGKGFFGFACSPLVEGDVVIVHVGGPGAGVVALDAASGKTRWAVTDDEAGYASPVAATVGGRRHVLSLTRQNLVALAPADGKVLWQHPFRSREEASVNAASPLVVGDEIFVSAAYGVGGALLKFAPDKPAVAWANDESMTNHYATCVVRDGMLYGLHGRQEQGPELRCVEWKTGKVRWRQEGVAAGSVTLAGDKLLILTDRGELVMADASPERFNEVGRKQVLGFESRAYPAVASGRVYAKGKDRLVCVDLRKAAP